MHMRRSIVCSAVFAALLAASAAAKPAVRELRPIPSTTAANRSAISADISRGRALFIQSCAPCHGLNAEGSEGPALKGLTLSATIIAKTVHDGVKDQMPAFGAQLTPSQIRQVSAYVGSLQKR